MISGDYEYGTTYDGFDVLDLPDAEKQRRKQEIIEAVYAVNDRERSPIQRYCGVPL